MKKITFLIFLMSAISWGQTELIVNGTFETGDLSGWEVTNAQQQTVSTDNPYAGTYSMNLNNTTLATANSIKAANLGEGVVQTGDDITISFWARGTTAAGGVLFAEFFTEIENDGGVSGGGILGGAPLALDANPETWKFFEFTYTDDTNASGGVTMQFNGATGGATGSLCNVFIDNVSITIAGDPVPPTCDDGIQNGDEEGVDCGGSNCDPCQAPSGLNITMNAGDQWGGFVNYNAITAGHDDGYEGGFGYDVPLLRTDVDVPNNTVRVFPNFLIWDLNDDTPGTGQFDAEWNPFWFSAPGVPSKNVELNTTVTVSRTTNPEYFNQDVTFSVKASDFQIDPSVYTVRVFIKIFNADFSSQRTYKVDVTQAGDYSVTLPLAEVTPDDQNFQWGFSVFGPIADDANEPARNFGGVLFEPFLLSNDEFTLNEVELNVSPNPTNNVWRVVSTSQIENIQVFDLLGKQVLSFTPNSLEVDIPAAQLKSGLYLATLTSGNSVKTVKLVKE